MKTVNKYLFICLLFLSFFGCKPKAVLLTDPIWLDMVGGQEVVENFWAESTKNKQLKGFLTVVDQENRDSELVQLLQNDSILYFFLTPLMSLDVIDLAEKYPNKIFIVLDRKMESLPENLKNIYIDRAEVYRQMGMLLGELQKDYTSNRDTILDCGGLFYSGSQASRLEEQFFIEGFKEKSSEPFFSYQVRNLSNRDQLRRNMNSLENSGLDIVVLSILNLNFYAMNQFIDTDIDFVVENLSGFSFFSNRIVFSVENNYNTMMVSAIEIALESSINQLSIYPDLKKGYLFDEYLSDDVDLSSYFIQ